ncbi:hypothetical protein BO70DRAFT_373439 [Aspergillus heteromorphus CBS 117.55]|uniref:Yeast cell wall synthesis Kre9/Knh1-like N-terminal domain-containing protein n=1 Tax=Aspergillus heteromorphus CBS 117.55 TaxID=1448321 RepID=A0A317VFZ9_9EURO|nr:uncharacterized protein BO70DRAFT_373439 [Aspergillus heteromorphus CBS 117.55]PWY72369.1 hypothetical protein BO70DRAFT_373439 [Aspergillus heteromorphus CBS 117.55]
MRFLTTALVSALAADPSGNAIYTPALNQIVPVGEAFDITWNATTSGDISLVLLRGPSTNMQVLSTIVDSTENTGSYTWTPSTSLEPDTTHYGLLLVVAGTGQYQYSDQFGISNPYYSSSSSVAAAATSTSSTSTSTAAATVETTKVVVATTAVAPQETVTVPHAAATKPAFTSVPVIKPSTLVSGSSTPSGTPAASSSSVAPVYTGAADRNAISFGAVAVGVAAVLAF